jgi:hypothetical protein
MLRKRNDSVKPGKGIDGDLGEDFVKPGPDMNFGYPGNINVPETNDFKGRKVRNSPGYAAYTSDDDAGLRRAAASDERGWATRDIFDDVIANSDIRGDSVNANTGPIKYGVNRKQEK